MKCGGFHIVCAFFLNKIHAANDFAPGFRNLVEKAKMHVRLCLNLQVQFLVSLRKLKKILDGCMHIRSSV